MKRILAFYLATWFGSGLIRPIILKGMAGTYGSFFSLPLVGLALYLTTLWWPSYVIITMVIFYTGLWCVPIAERMLGKCLDWRGEARWRDQNQIVIDETLGMLVTFIPLAWLTVHTWWLTLLIGFGLFRVFDIVKLPPAKFFDRQHIAMGVMLDDVAAGVHAATLLWILVTTLGL